MAVKAPPTAGFYEDDEDPDQVRAAFDRIAHSYTHRPTRTGTTVTVSVASSTFTAGTAWAYVWPTA
jgi:hypothetical protein